MKKTNRHIETQQHRAAAYNDAVRDILHSDGVFHLVGDERRPDVVWQWDGLRWKRLPIEDCNDEAPSPPPPRPRGEHDTTMVAAG